MTRKELQQVKEEYRELAEAIIDLEDPYKKIVGIVGAIAEDGCYNHHERGQRIWAFFAALEEATLEK